jgi:hypothetical protein
VLLEGVAVIVGQLSVVPCADEAEDDVTADVQRLHRR